MAETTKPGTSRVARKRATYLVAAGVALLVSIWSWSPGGSEVASAKAPSANAHASSDEAVISFDKSCYREDTAVRLAGHGFTPGKALDIVVSSGPDYASVADTAGGFAETFPAPGVWQLFLPKTPEQERVTVKVEEQTSLFEPAGISAEGSFLVTTLAVASSPELPKFFPGRLPSRVAWRLSGFVSGRWIYAHYRHAGKTRAIERLGRARGPCGTLRTGRRPFRGRFRSHAGTWTIQFDQQRSYSSRSQPRQRVSLRVTRSIV